MNKMSRHKRGVDHKIKALSKDYKLFDLARLSKKPTPLPLSHQYYFQDPSSARKEPFVLKRPNLPSCAPVLSPTKSTSTKFVDKSSVKKPIRKKSLKIVPKIKDIIKIWTDGAALPTNPGKGGSAAIIIINDKLEKEIAKSFRYSSSNRMEIMGAIIGLEYLDAKRTTSGVAVKSDSQYLVNTINKGWNKHKNSDLWKRLNIQLKKHQVTFEWIRGHSGDKWNELADKLANNAALVNDNPEIDYIYEADRKDK